jgi:hypothetical protein
LVENIHELINHEDERKKSIKRYFIRRIKKSDYDLINRNYNDLKQRIQEHLENRSEESWRKLSRFSNEYFPPRVDGFATVTDDIRIIIPFLDNPYLIDKFGLITFYAGQLKGYAAELGEYRDRDDLDIIYIRTTMDSLMVSINGFVDLLMDEVDNKLD